jgi:hypothetical protein
MSQEQGHIIDGDASHGIGFFWIHSFLPGQLSRDLQASILDGNSIPIKSLQSGSFHR